MIEREMREGRKACDVSERSWRARGSRSAEGVRRFLFQNPSPREAISAGSRFGKGAPIRSRSRL